jgi:hypothetical protein
MTFEERISNYIFAWVIIWGIALIAEFNVLLWLIWRMI